MSRKKKKKMKVEVDSDKAQFQCSCGKFVPFGVNHKCADTEGDSLLIYKPNEARMCFLCCVAYPYDLQWCPNCYDSEGKYKANR